MLFSDYKKHNFKEVNPKLLWEYDLSDFDYQDMRNIVVQRVIERGWPDDFYAILNLYGEEGVQLTDFILVGGTALALQVGHRDSIDLDLFTKHPFDASELDRYLSSFLK